MNKQEIRKNVLEKRKNLENSIVDCISLKIYRNLLSTKILNFNSILAYSSFNNEVRTDLIINTLLGMGREVYLPKCNISSETFDAVRITDNRYINNKYGISEPLEDSIKTNLVDCAIVPGIAFDVQGNRIGFGKGYYDKFLEHNCDAYKIGLCYEFQLLDDIASEVHDIKMDVIVTEDRVIYTKTHK